MNEALHGNANTSRRQYHIQLPSLFASSEIGLGDLIKRITSLLGIQPCEPCKRRAERLNEVLVLSGSPTDTPSKNTSPAAFFILRKLSSLISRMNPLAANDSFPCTHYYGRCTGAFWWASRQCIDGLATPEDPYSNTVTQCCSGWFQYPWIESCPGQPPTSGCGSCLW